MPLSFSLSGPTRMVRGYAYTHGGDPACMSELHSPVPQAAPYPPLSHGGCTCPQLVTLRKKIFKDFVDQLGAIWQGTLGPRCPEGSGTLPPEERLCWSCAPFYPWECSWKGTRVGSRAVSLALIQGLQLHIGYTFKKVLSRHRTIHSLEFISFVPHDHLGGRYYYLYFTPEEPEINQSIVIQLIFVMIEAP